MSSSDRHAHLHACLARHTSTRLLPPLSWWPVDESWLCSRRVCSSLARCSRLGRGVPSTRSTTCRMT